VVDAAQMEDHMVTAAPTYRPGVAPHMLRTSLSLAVVFAVGLAVGLIVPLNRAAVAPSSAATVAPHLHGRVTAPAKPAPGPAIPTVEIPDAAASVAAYLGTLRNIAAADAAHDPRQAAAFRQQLQRLSTAAVASAVTARYQLVSADLEAAFTRHDGQALHVAQVKLIELCASPGFLSATEGCRGYAR